jgi:hypothetical protein
MTLKNCSVSDQPEPPAARLKLALMGCIDESIRERYRTLQEAARTSKIDREILSRIRHGRHRRCSIASLLGIAERLQIHIKINVRLVKHRKVAISGTKSSAPSQEKLLC